MAAQLDCATSREFWPRDIRDTARRRAKISNMSCEYYKKVAPALTFENATSRDPFLLRKGRVGRVQPSGLGTQREEPSKNSVGNRTRRSCKRSKSEVRYRSWIGRWPRPMRSVEQNDNGKRGAIPAINWALRKAIQPWGGWSLEKLNLGALTAKAATRKKFGPNWKSPKSS
jgi:hypothetical protein